MTARVVGSLAWEQAGGPPLSFSQRIALLAGAGAVLASHAAGWVGFRLSRRGLWPTRVPPRVDLSAWRPPATAATREAEAHLRAVCSDAVIHHSLRTYYFSAVAAELAGLARKVDREALFVAAALHDVTLADPNPPPNERCFTVGCAREARRILTAAGWETHRQDQVAAAITSNLSSIVSIERFGLEAHVLSRGGQTEVFAQEWKIHPETLAEILTRHPRRGFAADVLPHVAEERRRHPGCRFSCLHPIFPLLVGHSTFTSEAR